MVTTYARIILLTLLSVSAFGQRTITRSSVPKATGTLIGGVVVGDGLTVDAAARISSPVTFVTTLSGVASAKTMQVLYDGSIWLRVSGNVSSDVGVNNLYTAIQYNAGSDRYERQFTGRAQFGWWKNSASNTWEQMKYAAGTKLPIQVANGDYFFNERVYFGPYTRIFGNEANPDSVRFHINGPNPYLFMNWYWMDGTAGKRAEGIEFNGFSLYNESTYAAVKDNNDFYGPISIDGGGCYGVTIKNIRYKQVSSTAIVNAILVKMGTQKTCNGLLIENVQSIASSVKGRMLIEVLNQGDGTNSPERVQVPALNVVIRNCIADGFRFGISIAGYFLKAKVIDCIVRNCTDYGIEFAGPLVDSEMDHCGFGGDQNVLIAGNYVSGSAADWVFPAGSGQRYTRNYTEGKVTGGYIEIRSGGVIDFSNNNFQIDGGVLLQNTQYAGVRGGQFANNRIISTMTNTNWRNQSTAILFMNGATDIDLVGNTLKRGNTDATAIVQSNANGLSGVVYRAWGNTLQVGTNGLYWGTSGTTGTRWNNYDMTATARN